METTINEQLVFNGKIFRVIITDVELADGRHARRDIVRHFGGCAVAALSSNGEIALVSQYRTAMGKRMLELPAGKRDKDEDPLFCARRELVEETGLFAKDWQKLGEYVASPGFCDEVIHLFLARDFDFGDQALDEDEEIDVIWMPLERAVGMIMSGEISDGKTISGIFMARERA
jgi:ADP-ribose pyrophosphatase